MKKFVVAAALAVFGLTGVTLVSAQANEPAMQPVPKELSDSIRKSVESTIGPGSKVQSIFKSPYFGLYEVRVGNNLLYTDAKVTYLFSGSVFDGKTLENLTEDRLGKLTAIKFQDLPLEIALKTVRGKGTRQLAVFEDPNCGYCKRFRKTLLDTDDATIYTFVIPVLGPDSLVKAKQLLCAADKSKAWDDWMLRNKMPPGDGDCNSAVTQLQELGRKLNVTGTPTVIFADGTRAAGAIPQAQLEQRLVLAAKVAK